MGYTLSQISTGMGDRLWAGIPPRYVANEVNSALHPSGVANWSLVGWGKCGNVSSAGWQVTLCDPIWHASSRSGEANCCKLLYSVLLILLYITF